MARPYGVGTEKLCPDCASSHEAYPVYPVGQVGEVRCDECENFLTSLHSLSDEQLRDRLIKEWPDDVGFSTFCEEFRRRKISMPA
jgi:hypothetical protein